MKIDPVFTFSVNLTYVDTQETGQTISLRLNTLESQLRTDGNHHYRYE